MSVYGTYPSQQRPFASFPQGGPALYPATPYPQPVYRPATPPVYAPINRPAAFPVPRPAYSAPARPTVKPFTPAPAPIIIPSVMPARKGVNYGQLLSAGALLAAGLLTHRLPARHSSFEMLSSDWKDWLRMGLGIMVVDRVNKAFEWKPAPWQLGLQSVTAITALSSGFTSLKGWRNFPLLAVMVPALVEATEWLNNAAIRQLEKHDSPVPAFIPKLAISATSTLLGIFALRRITGTATYQRWTGQEANGTKQMIGAEAAVCSRCGGQHIVCMTEIGDMLGSLGVWLKGNHRKETR